MSEDQFNMMDDISLFPGRKKEPCKSRKSRNMSEKRRRDQFNNLINELCTMVSKSKKMDKTTVLKTAIASLKSQKERADEMRSHEIKEVWKPSFMSNNEFEHLMLEAVNGFLILFDKNGKVIHVSESVTPLLGHSSEQLVGSSLFDLLSPADKPSVVNQITKHKASSTVFTSETPKEDYYITFDCNLECEGHESSESPVYELVHFEGIISFLKTEPDEDCDEGSQELCFCCVVKLCNLQLIREQSATEREKKEFTARHSLEWKFLFLDHRGPPIIGYLPLEVLGTSGYDYIHPDDIQELAKSHNTLMQSGEGQSCYYRFLTKGQQWIWLCTHYYITYHQWNSKPEFVVCTNRVVTYAEVQKYKDKDCKQHSVVKKHASVKKNAEKQSMHDENQQVTTSSEKSDADSGNSAPVEIKIESQPSESQERTEDKNVPQQQLKPAPVVAEIDPGCTSSQQLVALQQPSDLQDRQLTSLQKDPGSAISVSTPNTIDAFNRIFLSSHPLVMTTLQQQLHLKLLEKQRELQESILKQHQELLKIHNQLSLTAELGSSLMLVQPKTQEESTDQNPAEPMPMGSLDGSGLLQLQNPEETARFPASSSSVVYPNLSIISPQIDPGFRESSTKLLQQLTQQQQQRPLQQPHVSPSHPPTSSATSTISMSDLQLASQSGVRVLHPEQQQQPLHPPQGHQAGHSFPTTHISSLTSPQLHQQQQQQQSHLSSSLRHGQVSPARSVAGNIHPLASPQSPVNTQQQAQHQQQRYQSLLLQAQQSPSAQQPMHLQYLPSQSSLQTQQQQQQLQQPQPSSHGHQHHAQQQQPHHHIHHQSSRSSAMGQIISSSSSSFRQKLQPSPVQQHQPSSASSSNPLAFDITSPLPFSDSHAHQQQQPHQSLYALSSQQPSLTTTQGYSFSQTTKSPQEATSSPSPAMLPQPSPSPIDMMLSHDPMINSGDHQAFESLSFSVNTQSEQGEYKIFDSIGLGGN